MPCRSPNVVDSQAGVLPVWFQKKSYCSLCCCFPNLPFSFSLSSLPPIPPVRCTPLRQFETQTFPSGSPFFWHSTAWLDPGLAVSASANEQSASILIWCGCILVDVKFRCLVLIVISRPLSFVVTLLQESYLSFTLFLFCFFVPAALPSFAISSVPDFCYDHFLGGAGISELHLVPGWTDLGALSFF